MEIQTECRRVLFVKMLAVEVDSGIWPGPDH